MKITLRIGGPASLTEAEIFAHPGTTSTTLQLKKRLYDDNSVTSSEVYDLTGVDPIELARVLRGAERR